MPLLSLPQIDDTIVLCLLSGLLSAQPMFSPPPIDSLFTAFREGREEGFAWYYRAYFPAICLYISKLLDQVDQTEDIAQESFIKLWNKRDQIKSPDHLRNFLYRVTRHACIDIYRDREAGKSPSHLADLTEFSGPIDETNALKSLILAETIRQVYKLAEELPERQRTAFYLTVIEGKKYKEAASLMGIDPETVRHQRYHALQSIRKRQRSL